MTASDMNIASALDIFNYGLVLIYGLVLDVATVLTTARVRVKELSGRDLSNGRSAITIRFEVKNTAELNAIRSKLLNIRDVTGSKRGQN